MNVAFHPLSALTFSAEISLLLRSDSVHTPFFLPTPSRTLLPLLLSTAHISLSYYSRRSSSIASPRLALPAPTRLAFPQLRISFPRHFRPATLPFDLFLCRRDSTDDLRLTLLWSELRWSSSVLVRCCACLLIRSDPSGPMRSKRIALSLRLNATPYSIC